jgi:hypothetical protein
MRALLLLGLAAATLTPADRQQVFRGGVESVAVSASVKRGSSPVANLTARDFRLYDNDVEQTIEALSIEAVPLDVTLFVDTSGSTAGALDRMKRNVRAIAAMLRPEDRFRLLTIGLSVESPVPWQPGRTDVTLNVKVVPGISLVYDAIFVALAHEPAPGRRHLVVAMTDGQDCGSLIDGERVYDVSGRSDAVLHWIYVSSSGDFSEHRANAWCSPRDFGAVEWVARAAERTGGEKHRSRFGDPAVQTFARVLDDFRQSYVLRYSPSGVTARGWHRIRVQVPAHPSATIRARSGYFGG